MTITGSSSSSDTFLQCNGKGSWSWKVGVLPPSPRNSEIPLPPAQACWNNNNTGGATCSAEVMSKHWRRRESADRSRQLSLFVSGVCSSLSLDFNPQKRKTSVLSERGRSTLYHQTFWFSLLISDVNSASEVWPWTLSTPPSSVWVLSSCKNSVLDRPFRK